MSNYFLLEFSSSISSLKNNKNKFRRLHFASCQVLFVELLFLSLIDNVVVQFLEMIPTVCSQLTFRLVRFAITGPVRVALEIDIFSLLNLVH